MTKEEQIAAGEFLLFVHFFAGRKLTCFRRLHQGGWKFVGGEVVLEDCRRRSFYVRRSVLATSDEHSS